MALNNASGDSSKGNQDCKDQEYVVRIPKVNHKRYSVMRFNSSLNIDVSKWVLPKMERENNLKEFKADEDSPKYGGGSEFGRDHRDEARRKKYGIITKKYNPDEQPWLLKLGGKGGKKFKGIREGGVTENASYYVFTQAPDGTFEAFPIEEWYNFSPIHCYKALSAEEAEEEFVRRDKVLNYFKIMRKKRQKDEGEGDDEDESESKGKNSKMASCKEFKISDVDDWMNDSDDCDEQLSGDNNDNDDEKSQKKNAKKRNNKKSKKKEAEEEALEESDEGDFDDREVDYITNSSSSEEEPEDEKANRELKGVEDEDALRKIDVSGDEEEEENKETEENPEAKEKPPEPKPTKQKQKKENSSDDDSSESDDSDFDDDAKFRSAMFMQKTAKKKNGSDNSANSSRANTPTRFSNDANKEAQRNSQKRKLVDSTHSSTSKRNKQDAHSSGVNFNSSSTDGITEDAIRRYLSRKPMTATDLLQKFKSKKTGMNFEQLATKIAGLLKKVNPHRQQIKTKMYFSLKS